MWRTSERGVRTMANVVNEFLVERSVLEKAIAGQGKAAGEAVWRMIARPPFNRLEFDDRVDRPIWEVLTEGQHTLLMLEMMRSTLDSHGFIHYLFETGEKVPDALASLRRVGAIEQAERIEWAIRQLPGGNAPEAPEAWPRLLRKLSQDIRDKVFTPMKQELLGEENFAKPIAVCVLEYVRANPEEFVKS